MTIIFARLNSKERVVMDLPGTSWVPMVLEKLHDKFGGDWLRIDKLGQ